MSEHAWVEDSLESYLAGGLDRAERDRLERHVAECGDCARALEQARGIDGRLEGLFAPVRPAAALEDRMIQAIREQPLRWRFRPFTRGGKRLIAAAAILLFAATGAAVSSVLNLDEFRMSQPHADNRLKQTSLALHGLPEPMDFEVGSLMPQGASTPEERRWSALINGTTLHGLNFSRDIDGSDVPTGSMASTLWGIPKVSSARPLESVDGLTLGSDWARDLTNKVERASPNEIAFSSDGRRLASGEEKEKVADANDKQQLAEKDINYSVERRSGISVPGQAKLLENLTEKQRTQKTAEAQNLGGMNNPTTAMPDSLIAKEWQAPGFGFKSHTDYFRPGEIFARSVKKPEQGTPDKAAKFSESRQDHLLGLQPSTGGFGAQPPKQKEPEKKPPVQPAPRVDNRKIIRSGEIEFEVESFDDAVAAIMKLVNATNGGFVATINSDKLANGKVKGSVVVRVPLVELDDLILNLRKVISKAGDLKGQRIGSQDVTKQYTDMESRLKAARTMEERLLNIIKSGKGEIKDLVAAEKELGVWRTKIEELEGEIRYYANQISLSTLTVNLTEKEIRLAAAVAERERIEAGIEVDDVEKAYQDAQKAISELKGRITKSELKQGTAGQFNALLYFEVAPDSAGLMRDRLRQLGNMVRLHIERVLNAEGGKMPLIGKLTRGDAQFQVSLYNLANVQPRETVTLKIAATDVAKVFRELREAVVKVKGRIVNSQLNEQDRQNVTGALEFHIRRDSEAALQAVLTETGEQLSRQVSRVPESDNVTDAKVLYKLDLAPASAIPPRENISLLLEVSDVATTLRAFNDEVRDAGGRVVQPPKVRQERTGKVLGRAVYDVPLTAAATLLEKLKNAGRTSASEVTPNPNAPDGKLAIARIEVVAGNAELLVPRDQGLWAEVRSGIATSLRGLSVSAGWLIIGVLFVLPWLVLLYIVVWATRKLIRRSSAS